MIGHLPGYLNYPLIYLVCSVVLLCYCERPPGNPDIKVSTELPDPVSFNFHIRPILSNNCFVCHGPDSSSRQADLRLDIFEGATTQLADGKRAIVPGNWRHSEMIRRISSDDPDVMMPPPHMKKRLTDREVALLKKWISKGAQWEPYWAFTPPRDAEVPVVGNPGFINNDIDNFIVKKLENNQLTPTAVADKSQLIRRLSYVLTGLPPSPEVVDLYQNDDDPRAYEKIVDGFLASSGFGEQWARHWMDLVRYADTRGHEFDYEVIGSWRYRDYLIRAFNEDVPYDQLVLEHLAGDLLEKPRFRQGLNQSVLGTAFYCLTEGKHSPVDTRADEAERIDNIIDVTTKTFQGLTVGCAKCHDHKFDPIPTTDYYSLYGIIESTRFTMVPAGLTNEKLQVFDSIKMDLQHLREYIAENVGLETASSPSKVPGKPQLSNSQLQMIGDFGNGDLQGWYANGIAFSNALGTPIIKGDRLIGLEPPKASSKIYGEGLQGALRSPTFVITRDSLRIRAAGKYSTVRIIMDNFQLIQDPIYERLRVHPDSPAMEDYSVDLSMWKGHKAFIELQVGNYGQRKGKGFHSYDIQPQAWLEVEHVFGYDSLTGAMSEENPGLIDRGEALQNWLKGQASVEEVALLSQQFQTGHPRISGLDKIKKALKGKSESLYDSAYIVGVTDGDAIESPVFIRGSYQNLSSYKVPHRFFSSISDTLVGFNGPGSGRLQFAYKVVDPQNPLTARVMVNRLWHHIFGRGIVETVDNFGLQGKTPTHPELLDHLATKFIREGWSIKKMVRYMVMSQAFQRTAEPTAESLEIDPENYWWHHYPVRRLTAESIRDAMLYVSGRMDTTMYGPPVPIYLTEFLDGRGRPSRSGPLDGAGRRSVYQRLMRNFLPPMMLAFDMPVPFSTFGNRNNSNVPSQSLTLMNDPFVIDQALFWAHRILNKPSTFEERLHDVYLRAFSRSVKDYEVDQAKEFFEHQAPLYDLTAHDLELELWKDYCHSIFNMKEFIFLI